MPPRQLTILSGKGGTGKTTVAASFFALAERSVAADCDVDAPNMHLLIDTVDLETNEFSGSFLARIDYDRCTRCGLCEDNCPFDAIADNVVQPLFCEGCGVCELVCPEEAVAVEPAVTGRTFVSETRYGILVHALLIPGAEATGKLVTETKDKATGIAEEGGLDVVLVDGSPGIGCPVIASIAGADLVLAVSEPTVSGLWGLERISGVADHFGVRLEICLNKSDINDDIADEVEKFASLRGGEVLARIPFDDDVYEATAAGKVLVESSDGLAARAIRSLWEDMQAILASQVDA